MIKTAQTTPNESRRRRLALAVAALTAICLLPALPGAAKTHIGLGLGLEIAPNFCAPPPPVCPAPAPVVVYRGRGHWEWVEERVVAGYETREERVWVDETRRREREWDPVREVWIEHIVIVPGHYETTVVEVPVYETVQRKVWVEDPPVRVHRRGRVAVHPRFGFHVSVHR